MPRGKRFCRRCQKYKDYSQFRMRGTSAGKRAGELYGACKPCESKRAAERCSEPMTYIREIAKARWRKNVGGVRGLKETKDRDIDYEYAQELWHKQGGRCAVTGIKMTTKRGTGWKLTPTNASIDRIDNELGYLKGNVHLVCDVVNRMKGSLTMDELRFWCKAVIKGTDDQ